MEIQASSSSAPLSSVTVRTKTFALGQLRHQVRITGTNENPWFVAKDIGAALGVKNMREALSNYKEGTEKGVTV